MNREIVLDTETTGISPVEGHRIVEIGALELINHMPTGNTFHVYLNPERDMPKDAEAVHGLSTAFLKDKPLFAKIVDPFLEFIEGATLVIHNASFDIGFLNAELSYVDKPAIDYGRVVDTLQMARRKHPMAGNSLDALCKRYGIDNSKRTKHGALLDSELLAEVYLELIGGRQTALDLAAQRPKTAAAGTRSNARQHQQRERPLSPRITAEELAAHVTFVDSLGAEAIWKK